jgi:hypothetical protein
MQRTEGSCGLADLALPRRYDQRNTAVGKLAIKQPFHQYTKGGIRIQRLAKSTRKLNVAYGRAALLDVNISISIQTSAGITLLAQQPERKRHVRRYTCPSPALHHADNAMLMSGDAKVVETADELSVFEALERAVGADQTQASPYTWHGDTDETC